VLLSKLHNDPESLADLAPSVLALLRALPGVSAQQTTA